MEYQIEIKPLDKTGKTKQTSISILEILSGKVIIKEQEPDEIVVVNTPCVNVVMAMDKNQISYYTEGGKHIRTIKKADKPEKGKGIYRWDNMDTNVPDNSNSLTYAMKKCQDSIKKFFGRWDINVVFN